MQYNSLCTKHTINNSLGSYTPLGVITPLEFIPTPLEFILYNLEFIHIIINSLLVYKPLTASTNKFALKLSLVSRTSV